MTEFEQKPLTILDTSTKFFKKSDIKSYERTCIIGKTGSGKSVLFDHLLHYFSKKALVVLLDTKNEYDHVPELKTKNLKEPKGLYKITEMEYKHQKLDNFKDICEIFSIALFDICTKAKKEGKPRLMIFAIEELGNVIRKYGTLYESMPEFAKVLQQGRSVGIGFLGTTQRTQEIHTTILSQCQHVICFKLTSTQDIHSVRDYFEKDWFYGLKQHQFFHLNYTHDYIRKCNKLYLTKQQIDYYSKIFGKP